MKSKVLIIFLFLLVAVTVVSAGEMDDWAYRKQITLNNSGSDLTDYQLKFTVYRSSGTDSGFDVYVSDKCQDDYDDIRFTTSDGLTLCNYWIETSDSSTATIWVKVPSIPAGNTTLYLYYGNPNATAISNGDNTFIFFDDFPGSSVDTSKWDIVAPSGCSVTISGGEATFYSSSGTSKAAALVSKTTYGVGYEAVARIKQSSSTTNIAKYTLFGFNVLYASGSGTYIKTLPIITENDCVILYDLTTADNNLHLISCKNNPFTTTNYGAVTTASTSYRNFYVRRYAGGTNISGYITGGTTNTGSSTNITESLPIVVGHDGHTAASGAEWTDYCDWVFVKKCATTEPTVSSWGSEETALPIVTPDFSATPTSGESPLTVYFSDMSIGGTIWPIHSINIDYWEWDFGDGSPKNYQQNPAHTYTQTGYFNVTLKSGNLTYGEYNTTTKTNYINVVVSSTVPVAEFMATPTCANTGTTIYFIDYSTGGGLYAWNWSFGDGTYSTLRNPTHQYSSNGLYDISLTVWGAYGSDTETKSGYIQIPCPTPTPTPTPTPSPTPIPTPTGTPPIQGEIPQARIPVLGFMVLAWVDLGLILYTFIDNENRNYMHIYSAVIAVILSFLLAVSLTNGFITEAHVLTDKEVTVNSSVLSTHLVEHVAVTDTGWSWFFAFLGVMMLIICVLSAIEAVKENTEEVM